MNKDLLMTYEQYKAARPGYVPYTYIIEKDGQYIFLVNKNAAKKQIKQEIEKLHGQGNQKSNCL